MKKSDKAWEEFSNGGDLDAKSPKPKPKDRPEDEKDDVKALGKEDVFK